MEKFKANDIIMTIKDVSDGNSNSNLPAFTLGIVAWQFPDSSLVVAEFGEEGMRTLATKNVIKI